MSPASVDHRPLDSQKDYTYHHKQFSLTKRSTPEQPTGFADDDIPVANPRRFSRAPRLDEEYRRAQGEGPISVSRGGSTAPRPLADKQLPMEPVYSPDQFAVNESMAASYRRRSWTLNPRGAAGPGKPALVTIAEFEEANEHPKSTYAPYNAPTSYTSPRASRSCTPERQHDTKSPPRSPPTPPKDQPVPKATASPSPKTTEPPSTPISPPTFHPHPNPNQYIQQSARRPHSQRIFRVNSRGTGVKRIPSKKQYMPKEKIISIGTGRPKIIEIIPAGRKRSWGIQNTASPPQELPVEIVPLSLELVATTASSPKKVRPAEVPAIVVGGTSPKQTQGKMPTLTITAPTPSTTPVPVHIPEPTRKAPLPPTEKTVYKPYRPPTPEPAIEKPLPNIPPLVTGWPDWKKVTDFVVEEKQEVEKRESDNVPGVATEIQGAKKVTTIPETKNIIEIPEPLRVGPKSLSVEAKKVVAVLEAMKMMAAPDDKKVTEIPEGEGVAEISGELKVKPEASSLKAKEVMAILEAMKVMAASEEKEVVVAPEVEEAIAIPEAKKAMVIPEVLRIGMGSSSLEARLGSWEALAAGERY